MKRFLAALLVALIIVVSMSVTAFAVDSPSPGTDPTVTVETSDPNAGTVTKESLGDNTYRFTASPAEGYSFEKWVIDGGYTIIEGSLTSPEIVIKATSDTLVIAYFNSTGTPGTTSPTSPNTGDSSVWVVLSIVIALVGAAYVCKKKIFA